MDDTRVEEIVEEVLSVVDEQECAQSDVPLSTTRSYYRQLIEGLKSRMAALDSEDREADDES